MLKWIEFSNVKFSIDLNPFCWSLKWHYQKPTKSDPHLRILYVRILPFSLALIFDNGIFVPWEDDIVPAGMSTGSDKF